MKPMLFFFVFLEMLFICVLHEMSSDIVILRYLAEDTLLAKRDG